MRTHLLQAFDFHQYHFSVQSLFWHGCLLLPLAGLVVTNHVIPVPLDHSGKVCDTLVYLFKLLSCNLQDIMTGTQLILPSNIQIKGLAIGSHGTLGATTVRIEYVWSQLSSS